MCITACCFSFMLQNPSSLVFPLILHKQTYIEYFILKLAVTPAGPLENKPAKWNKNIFLLFWNKESWAIKSIFWATHSKIWTNNLSVDFFVYNSSWNYYVGKCNFPLKETFQPFSLFWNSVFTKSRSHSTVYSTWISWLDLEKPWSLTQGYSGRNCMFSYSYTGKTQFFFQCIFFPLCD